MKRNTTEDFIRKAKNVHGDKYDYSLVDYVNNTTKVIVICPEHGNFLIRPSAHIIQKQSCRKCKKTESYDEFVIKSNKKHNNKYHYDFFKWENSKQYINIFCKKHKGYFKQRINDHLNGIGCAICNKNIITKEKFINKTKNSKYEYLDLNFHNSSDFIKIICPEHGEFEQSVYNHYIGCGCPKCAGRNRTTEDFINISTSIHGDKYDYSLVEYKNTRTKVKIICKKHGEFEQSPNKHITVKQGCPKCKISKGERCVKTFLENHNIIYETQKKFNGCIYKNELKFDFYLPDHNTCIEYDGEQHFEKYRFEKDNKILKIRQLRDKMKDEYCKENNIGLIRIKYNENIQKILKQKINFL